LGGDDYTPIDYEDVTFENKEQIKEINIELSGSGKPGNCGSVDSKTLKYLCKFF
jgi:hypothetical protein